MSWNTHIPKFRRFVLQNFPFIEEDFDALTDYQLICKVVEYLNKVITSQNGVVAEVERFETDITSNFNRLEGLFNDLKSFVDNYFDNFDVQQEINNKLDQMAEDGTLQEIITSYIQSNVAWTFDTIADMKLATNLVNGSFARTLGFHTLNDGGGAIYKIRNLNESETANEMDLISINDTLVAELVVDNEINLKKLGLTGNGAVDNFFTRALNLSQNITISDGTYNITKVDVRKDINLNLVNCKLIKTSTESVNESGAIEIRGSVKSTTSITSDVTELSNTIPVADSSIFTIGDTVEIYYPDAEATDVNHHKRLMTTVTKITDNNITIADGLNWDYTTSAKVSVINTVTANIKGDNFVFENNNEVGRGYFLYLRFNRNTTVSNLNMEKSACGVVRAFECIDNTYTNLSGKIPASITPPYGEFVNIIYSTNINCDNIHTIGYRRTIDYTGATYCRTENSLAEAGGFTSHGQLSRYCEYVNCTVIMEKGAIAPCNTIGNLEFFYDKDIVFDSCTIINGNRGIYAVNTDTTLTIKNCYFKNVTEAIVNYGITMLNIENCTFENSRTIINTENANSTGYVTVNNIYLNTTSTNHGLFKGAVTNPIKIYNSSFDTGEYITNTTPIIMRNCNINSSPSTAVTLVGNSAIYDTYVNKNIVASSNTKVIRSNFRNISSTGDNISNIYIEANTYTGTINVTASSESNIYVSNNTKLSYTE